MHTTSKGFSHAKKRYTQFHTLWVNTHIKWREKEIRGTTGVVSNLENESQTGSNHPATRSYRAVKNPSQNRETLQDSG